MQAIDRKPDADSAAVAAQAPPPVFPAGQQPMSVQTNITIDREFMTQLGRRAALVIAVVAVVVGAIMLGVNNWQWVATWMRVGGTRPPLIHAVVRVVPTSRCMPLTKEQILAGRAGKDNEIDLRDIRATLLHHLTYARDEKAPLFGRGDQSRKSLPQGICAPFLGYFPICMCMINFAEPQDAPDYQTMYNVRLIGVSPDNINSVHESSLLCENPFWTVRYGKVGAEWLAEDGDRRHRDFAGTPAQTVQQMISVCRGIASCRDTNEQAGIAGLYDLFDEFRQDMLFGAPDVIERISAAYVSQRMQGAAAANPPRQLPS